MKIVELKPVNKNRRGRLNKNGIKLEPHEEKTAILLTFYGFDIEIIKPVNTPKVNNPDVFIMGSLWEMKAPEIYNENTLKKHFKKAGRQSDKVIFDLRRAGQDVLKIEKFIIHKFREPGRIRRIIIIRNDSEVLDIFK